MSLSLSFSFVPPPRCLGAGTMTTQPPSAQPAPRVPPVGAPPLTVGTTAVSKVSSPPPQEASAPPPAGPPCTVTLGGL